MPDERQSESPEPLPTRLPPPPTRNWRLRSCFSGLGRYRSGKIHLSRNDQCPRSRTCNDSRSRGLARFQARRGAGLSSFPGPPPAGSACPKSGPRRRDEAGYSSSPGPLGALPVRSGATKLLAPAVIGHHGHANRPRSDPRRQHINLPQLRDILWEDRLPAGRQARQRPTWARTDASIWYSSLGVKALWHRGRGLRHRLHTPGT